MATSLTIAPALGHAAVAAQGQSGGYDAIDFRAFWGISVQQGVVESGAFMVTERGAGANMSVDVACNSGHAVVQGDSVANQGLYVVRPHTAVANLDIATAHGTNPRVDAVVVQLDDDEHDSSGNTRARVMTLAGTATAGATLDNARDGSHGGAAIPSSAFHLADVLVPATDTTISNSQIRDRRSWARGAYWRSRQESGADYTTSSTSFAEIDATNFKARIECTGNPIRVMLRAASVAGNAEDRAALFQPWVDGVTAVGTSGDLSVRGTSTGAIVDGYLHIARDIIPAAGSHLISWAWASTAAAAVTMERGTDLFVEMVIEEIVRQNAKNNSTTSG